MPRMLVILLSIGSLCPNLGCGPGAIHEVRPSPTVDEPQHSLVDNPHYVHWNQFPVGTTIRIEKSVKNPNGTVHVVTTQKLASKSSEKIVVEAQITVDRPDRPLQENPPMELEHVARFQLPPEVDLEKLRLPSLKAQPTGTETVTIGGVDYQATLYEFQESNEAGPMDMKVWWCEQFPGRMLRVESHVLKTGETSIEKIAQVSIRTD